MTRRGIASKAHRILPRRHHVGPTDLQRRSDRYAEAECRRQLREKVEQLAQHWGARLRMGPNRV